MEKIKVEDAVGMPLCHDLTAMYPGFKGARFKRGHVIEKEDIEVLLDMGKKTVYAGELDEDLLHEEDCALRLADAVKVKGAHYEEPSEGKVLLIADMEGMLRINTSMLKELNGIGDITVTTLPDHYRVKKGARLASMRIVPLFTKKDRMIKAEELISKSELIQLLPFKPLKAGIVITGSEIYEGRIRDRFEDVVRSKLSHYPGEISGVEICDDDMDMIVNKARGLLSAGSDLLIFSGGMSVDPDDMTPGAIKKMGADIISYGVPSQPGNMTLIAYINDVPVLGVPGAALNLPTTLFDVLLPQIYSGLKLTKQDLINLGDGGLCQMCKDCHYPNCTFGRY